MSDARQKKTRYTLKKDGRVLEGMDCVLLAKSRGEELGAQLWRNLPDRSYMVCDYGVTPGDEG